MSDEVKIVRVEAGDGPIVKVANRGYAGHCYRWPVVYVLEDDRRQEGSEKRTLLRDAKAEVAKLPKEIDNMTANFGDNGEFWGTTTAYRLCG
jgi:hypothetical protein